MTGRELILLLTENGLLDYEIEVQYRDGGGEYTGTEKIAALYDIQHESKVIVL
ncbi:MAG TPA: hypothetical protein GXZ90_00430 [Clostridiales bacterium]|nr:hypothetical protein [Clostridiales bacterium]